MLPPVFNHCTQKDQLGRDLCGVNALDVERVALCLVCLKMVRGLSVHDENEFSSQLWACVLLSDRLSTILCHFVGSSSDFKMEIE